MESTQVDRIIRRALEEDIPFGDLTTEVFVPAGAAAQAELVAREPGVLSGGEVFAQTFRNVDPTVEVTLHTEDGGRFEAGQTIASVNGAARPILTGERVALNLLQRMSGIATLTAAFVEAAAGSGARIVDTRKTTPGCGSWSAMRCGAAAAATTASPSPTPSWPRTTTWRCSAEKLATCPRPSGQLEPGSPTPSTSRWRWTGSIRYPRLEGGADTIMLDNFSAADLRRGVEMIGGRALVEASGGVTLETVARSPRREWISSASASSPTVSGHWTWGWTSGDLSRPRGHGPSPPGSPGGDVAVPDRPVRQPLLPS